VETSKVEFIPHFIGRLEIELEKKLPERTITTKMLLHTGAITQNFIAHVISAIHKEMNDADSKLDSQED
jgi:hypothetical protein